MKLPLSFFGVVATAALFVVLPSAQGLSCYKCWGYVPRDEAIPACDDFKGEYKDWTTQCSKDETSCVYSSHTGKFIGKPLTIKDFGCANLAELGKKYGTSLTNDHCVQVPTDPGFMATYIMKVFTEESNTTMCACGSDLCNDGEVKEEDEGKSGALRIRMRGGLQIWGLGFGFLGWAGIANGF